MAVGFASIQAKATNDEVHLLQSARFLRGTAQLVSTINEGQIANALADVVYLPGKSSFSLRVCQHTWPRPPLRQRSSRYLES
jgi:hypothetical protein